MNNENINMPNQATEPEQFDTLPIPPAETGTLSAPVTGTLSAPVTGTLSATKTNQPDESPNTDPIPETCADGITPQQRETDNTPATMDQHTKDAAESPQDTQEEDEKRTAHETAENKRKEEWEAKQQAKRAAEQEALRLLAALPEDELINASLKKVATDTERLTRRNMKLCVMEWIQTKCLDDPAFARLTMHPRKNMINCFHYINRKAKEYITQEMKDNDIPQNGIYGGDVPDDLCYQWAEQYFQDPDAGEDQEKEEKFIPKPYISSSGKKSAKTKKTEKKKSESPKAKNEATNEAKKTPDTDKTENNIPNQMTLFDLIQEVPA